MGRFSLWKVSHSVVSNSFRPRGLYSPCNSPGQNTGVGSLSFLQGIFPTQGSNPGLPHCRQILYQLSHRGIPNIVVCWLTFFGVILFKLLISFLCLAAFVSQLPHLLNWECCSLSFQDLLYSLKMERTAASLQGGCDDQMIQNYIKRLAECSLQRRSSVNITAPAPVSKHASLWYAPWLDYLFVDTLS